MRIALIAAALITGLAVSYNFNKPSSPEIRRAIPVTGTEPEVRKAIAVEPEVRRAIPVEREVRKAIPLDKEHQIASQTEVYARAAEAGAIADVLEEELASRERSREAEMQAQTVTRRVEPLPDDEEPSHSFTSYLFTTPNGDSIIGTTSQLGNFGFHHFSTPDGNSINGTSTRIGNTVFHNFTGSNGQIGNGTTTEW
jgi:hypothetical protein